MDKKITLVKADYPTLDEMGFAKIQNERNLNSLLWTENTERGLIFKENEWRMGPLRYDDHDLVTAWGIFTRHPETGDVGDVYPLMTDINYWDGLELCRNHNASHSIFEKEDPKMWILTCIQCREDMRSWMLNSMQVCKSCMEK